MIARAIVIVAIIIIIIIIDIPYQQQQKLPSKSLLRLVMHSISALVRHCRCSTRGVYLDSNSHSESDTDNYEKAELKLLLLLVHSTILDDDLPF